MKVAVQVAALLAGSTFLASATGLATRCPADGPVRFLERAREQAIATPDSFGLTSAADCRDGDESREAVDHAARRLPDSTKRKGFQSPFCGLHLSGQR